MWNGSALTDADIAESASVGLGAGHIVYWGKAAALIAQKTFTISADGYEDAVIKVKFVNTAS